MGFVKSISS